MLRPINLFILNEYDDDDDDDLLREIIHSTVSCLYLPLQRQHLCLVSSPQQQL